MEVKVKTKENPLFSRKEVDFWVEFQGGTPSRKQVKEALKNSLYADERLLVIVRMKQVAGEQRIEGHAHLYSDTESLKKYEPEFRLRREADGKEENVEGKT